jgi:hypothetical protein
MKMKNKMKKQLLFMAIAGLFTSMASAADLYVRDLGAGGAYSTISDAITAANDGDRIIVRPKSGNVPYLENVTINKSLTFVSEIDFAKYYVQGTIIVTPAVNRTVTISNMFAFQSSITSAGAALSGGRCTINILNCTVSSNIYLNTVKNVTANVYQSTCKNLFFVHGKVVANTVESINLTDDIAPLATTDVQIIANNMYYNGVSMNMVTIATSSYAFKMFNNDINNYYGNYSALMNTVEISAFKAGSTNLIHNNRITASSVEGNNYPRNVINISASTAGIINIANNILNTPHASYYEINSVFTPTVVSNNNFSNTYNVNGVDAGSGNVSGTYTLDMATGIATGGILNGGMIDEEYQDIDLTRNDIGPYGGSNSWANYWPAAAAANKPRVIYLNTPRRIYNGTTTMPMEATGISK